MTGNRVLSIDTNSRVVYQNQYYIRRWLDRPAHQHTQINQGGFNSINERRVAVDMHQAQCAAPKDSQNNRRKGG